MRSAETPGSGAGNTDPDVVQTEKYRLYFTSQGSVRIMRCVLSVCHGLHGLLVVIVRALVTDILDPLEQIERAASLIKNNHTLNTF